MHRARSRTSPARWAGAGDGHDTLLVVTGAAEGSGGTSLPIVSERGPTSLGGLAASDKGFGHEPVRVALQVPPPEEPLEPVHWPLKVPLM